jgi:hypothetical protein
LLSVPFRVAGVTAAAAAAGHTNGNSSSKRHGARAHE